MLLLNFLQIEVGIIDHICKVDLIALFQCCLIVMIHFLCNFQEKQCSWVVRLLAKEIKSLFVITGGLILLDKVHHKLNQFEDVFILAGIDDLLINFVQISGLQNKAFFFKDLTQMYQQRATVIVQRPSLQQFSFATGMHIPFVPDSLLVLYSLLGCKQRVVAVFTKSIVLQPGGVLTLANVKIGSILFVSCWRLKGIRTLIFVVNAIQIQEISDLHFLNGAQEFTGQGFDPLGALLLHLLHILTKAAFQGLIVLCSLIKMILIHIIELENIFLKVEVIT